MTELDKLIQSEYGKLCKKDKEFKKNNPFKQYKENRLKQLEEERKQRIASDEKIRNKWSSSRTAPTLWEKIDKDPKYALHLRLRTPMGPDGYPIGEASMSNRKTPFREPKVEE